MKNISIGGKRFDEVFGATGPGPIWQLAMNDAVRGMPEQEFETVYIPNPPPKRDPSASPGSGSGSPWTTWPGGQPTDVAPNWPGGRTQTPFRQPTRKPAQPTQQEQQTQQDQAPQQGQQGQQGQPEEQHGDG